jgi:glycosyltransferase involved in cell wall biosynthesis
VKVAYVHIYTPFGETTGVENFLLTVLRGLDQKRYKACVLVTKGSPFAKDVRDTGTEVIEVDVPLGLLQITRQLNPQNLARVLAGGPRFLKLRSDLGRTLREWGADVVHTNHHVSNFYGGAGAEAARLPCVWHVHEPIFNKTMAAIYRAGAKKYADHIVCVSEWERVVNFPDRKAFPNVDVVYNGFDFPAFRAKADGAAFRTELGLSSDTPVIGYVSHLAPFKGQPDFLAALPEVLREFPNARAVVVGGAVYKAYRDYDEVLKNQARELGILDKVIFTGARRDVASAMQASDIYACCSRTEEFNRVVIEAMSLGVPAVTTTPRKESVMVENNVTGILVPPENPKAMGDAFRRLLADAALRTRLGEAGRAYVERTFSIEKTVSDLCAIYDRLAPHAVSRSVDERTADTKATVGARQ